MKISCIYYNKSYREYYNEDRENATNYICLITGLEKSEIVEEHSYIFFKVKSNHQYYY